MSLTLSSPVTDMAGIGPAKAQSLHKLSVHHVRDFLYTWPRRYDDFSNVTAIEDLEVGAKMTVKARVKRVKTDYGWRGSRRLLRIFVDLEDETGELKVTWYNLRFLPRQLWRGREIRVAGVVEENRSDKQEPLVARDKSVWAGAYRRLARHRMRSPVIEFSKGGETTHTGRIIPVYAETSGITSRFIRYQVKNLLPLVEKVPEYLPEEIRRRNKLMGIRSAIKEAHFPSSGEKLAQARARLQFDELFFLQLAALVRRRDRRAATAARIKVPAKAWSEIIGRLPFALTGAQARAVEDVRADLRQASPMNRLLQGDVGSGKSAVALVVAQAVMSRASKIFYLAPTEILARQQAELFGRYMPRDNLGLLTGSSKRSERDKISRQLVKPGPYCLLGTHALFSEGIAARDLVLAIVDEQHRFGVGQRKALVEGPAGLTEKGEGKASARGRMRPHLLSMTATPIPRTLSLTVYGDLDVSVLDEMPPGRQNVKTEIVTSAGRDKAIRRVEAEIRAGRQAYVIAPLIEQSEKLQVKSAQEIWREMRQLFPGVAIELAHGQMKSEAKESVMNNFNAGAIQMLVATAMVEVGVNVPNATVMIIEGAERFGLAQLHQFRGRIGRGERQAYCYLFPSADELAANKRLVTLCRTSDGFEIAEADLRLRGPGEMYGAAQSGYGNLQIASLLDYRVIKLARAEAEKILESDPDLARYPILRKKVERKNLLAHFE